MSNSKMRLARQHQHFRQSLLSEEYVSGLADHINVCPACRRLSAHLREVDQLAASVAARIPTPPADLLTAVLANTMPQELSLPVELIETVERRAAIGQHQDSEDPAADYSAPRVLLVEDDSTCADMYRLRLELGGCLVEVAEDGLQALRRATESPPEIIVLDIRLPKLDGLAVLEALMHDQRAYSIPVVILSGYDELELIERGLRYGAVEYLVKCQTSPARLTETVLRWVKVTNKLQR